MATRVWSGALPLRVEALQNGSAMHGDGNDSRRRLLPLLSYLEELTMDYLACGNRGCPLTNLNMCNLRCRREWLTTWRSVAIQTRFYTTICKSAHSTRLSGKR